jgi:hypothetical protein
MSACLFTISLQSLQKYPIESIRKMQENWKIIVNDFESDLGKRDNKFECDRYCGARDNIEHVEWFLAGFENGFNSKKEQI